MVVSKRLELVATAPSTLRDWFLDAVLLVGWPRRQDLAGVHDIAVRHGFIRKVFGILGVQLLITTAIAAARLSRP